VGIVLHRKVGDPVSAGEPLCTVHFNSETKAQAAARLLLDSYQIEGVAPALRKPLVHRVIQGKK
jgi:pyrimidine-nucleoside phosphorylase